MAPVKNGRLLFNEVPQGFPEPGKTTVYDETETIDLETVPLNGGFLVKTLVLSIDPYMRGRMRDASTESYSAPFAIGKPLDNFGVGVVLRTETSDVKVGDHVYGIFPFQQYFVAQTKTLPAFTILQNKENLPWSVYVGAAGMPGQTAFTAWKEYAEAKKGETAFVTTGAGPVGAFVIQLAKADGLKVIASAGSEEKVAFMKSIGADVAFNYKTEDTYEVLKREGPINVYWDNVGGSSLDAALQYAAPQARFIECGMISGYNAQAPPVKNLMSIISKQLRIYGFLVTSILPKYFRAFYSEVPAALASGAMKYTEDVTEGLQNAGQAIYEVQAGKNKGKSVIRVAQE